MSCEIKKQEVMWTDCCIVVGMGAAIVVMPLKRVI